MSNLGGDSLNSEPSLASGNKALAIAVNMK